MSSAKQLRIFVKKNLLGRGGSGLVYIVAPWKVRAGDSFSKIALAIDPS